MSWRRKILFGVVIWLSLWFALEILLRFFGYGGFILYVPDSELLWLPGPSQTGKTVVGRKRITINSQGLRYRVDLDQRNPREHRVVAFGDSVTMGWGVDDESHYCAVLERRLAESSPNVQFRVISAGVNAYPISLCVRRFAGMLAHGDQIDTAILAYSFNKRFERLALLDDEGKRKLLRRVRLKNLVRRSAVYNFVIEDWLRKSVYYRVRNRLVDGSWDTAQAKPDSDLTDYYENLDIMRKEAERRGIRVIFILLGSKGQRGDLSENQTAFLEYGKQNGIPVINMIERFESLNHDSLFMDHVHPTGEGHSLIAGSLLNVVADQR